MARSERRSASKPRQIFGGEIWTDARGRATVVLPTRGRELESGLQYELEYALKPLIGGGKTRVAAELAGGCFLIESDEPHVKVAWQLTANERT